MPERCWDVTDWYANIDGPAAAPRLGSRAPALRRASKQTVDWYKALPDKPRYERSSKKFGLDTVYSVSAIVACYKDNQAIPIMYERLMATFTQAQHRFRDHLRQRLQPRRHARK